MQCVQQIHWNLCIIYYDNQVNYFSWLQIWSAKPLCFHEVSWSVLIAAVYEKDIKLTKIRCYLFLHYEEIPTVIGWFAECSGY